MRTVVAGIVGYLCGALPFGVWIARRAGVDIRRAGSGNIGATNVARSVGARAALATLAGDILKGFLPVWSVRHFLSADDRATAVAGTAAVFGHVFPLFAGFAGGKGVATVFGVFLELAPAAALVCALVFLVVVRWSGYVSLGSLVAVGALPVVAFALSSPAPATVAAVPIAALVFFRHRENIHRLRSGTETSFRVRE